MQTEIEKLASKHYPEYYSIGLGNDKIGFERGYNLGISSQTEISDEISKIEKALYNAWSDYEYQNGNLYSTTFRDGWLMAIDWYKKELRK